MTMGLDHSASTLQAVAVDGLLETTAVHEVPAATVAAGGPRHFAFVDALRGIALLGVVMIHVTENISGGPMLRFGWQGGYGVQLFFVISAFTLFWSLRSRVQVDRRPLISFFVRRVFRIGPLFWTAAIFYYFHPGYWRAMFTPVGIGRTQILTTVFFLHGWSPTTCNAVVPGGWSIATEFSFYLCVPLLFRWIRSLSAAMWLTLVTTAVAAVASPVVTEHLARYYPPAWKSLIDFFVLTSLPVQLPVFCLGMVLYFLLLGRLDGRPVDQRSASERDSSNATMALILVSLAPALFFFHDIPPHVVWGIAFVALAFGLAIQPFRLIVNPVTRYFGVISFSGYIWHFWIIEKVAPKVLSLSAISRLSVRWAGTLQFVVLFAVVTLSTVGVATASYYLIEAPGQAVGRWLIDYFCWGRKSDLKRVAPQ